MEGLAHVPLLVIGAGPYGLSTAAHAKRHGIDPFVVGEPMGFWRRNMPERMLLRSGTDWHLDADGSTPSRHSSPSGVWTPPGAAGAARTFLDYADWFCTQTGIEPDPELVSEVEKADGQFAVGFENGRRLTADAVVAAPGIAHFPVIPDWVPGALPEAAGPTPAPSSSSSSSTRLAC